MQFLGGFFTWAKEMVEKFNLEFQTEIQNVHNSNSNQDLSGLNGFIQSLNGKGVSEKALMIAGFLMTKSQGQAQNHSEEKLRCWMDPHHTADKDVHGLYKLAKKGDGTYQNIEMKLLTQVQQKNRRIILDRVILCVKILAGIALSILLILLAPALGSPLWIALVAASVAIGLFSMISNILMKK